MVPEKKSDTHSYIKRNENLVKQKGEFVTLYKEFE